MSSKMHSSEEDRLMTLAELARFLHMGEKTVLKLVTSKKLPGVLIEKQWRFQRSRIDEWLEQQAGGGEDFSEIPDGMKVPLGDLLPAEGIIADMRTRDALGAIEELAARAYANAWLNDKPWFIGALVEREALASTAMEGGVAFLHTRARDMGKISRPFIIVGRSYDGIEFGAPDRRPTHLFFLLGLKYDRLHLPILGRLARTMRNPQTIAKLRATTSSPKMRNLLLQLDAAELTAGRAARVDYGPLQPVLDRDLRLRAIMRLNAKRKHDARRAETAAKAAEAKAAASRRSSKPAAAAPPAAPRTVRGATTAGVGPMRRRKVEPS
jgi:excisionase family DNA binding protein